jgi:hypothetical protein
MYHGKRKIMPATKYTAAVAVYILPFIPFNPDRVAWWWH